MRADTPVCHAWSRTFARCVCGEQEPSEGANTGPALRPRRRPARGRGSPKRRARFRARAVRVRTPARPFGRGAPSPPASAAARPPPSPCRTPARARSRWCVSHAPLSPHVAARASRGVLLRPRRGGAARNPNFSQPLAGLSRLRRHRGPGVRRRQVHLPDDVQGARLRLPRLPRSSCASCGPAPILTRAAAAVRAQEVARAPLSRRGRCCVGRV